MEKSILPAAWQVPQVFRDRLGASAGRQRCMLADGHLLLVTHAPPKPEDNARVGRFFWRDPDGDWKSNELGTGFGSLKKHLDEYEDLIARLDRREEQANTTDDYFAVLERLTPVHRAARNLHQVLQEARKACPDYRDLIDLRDRAYAIERTADLLFEGTNNELQFAVARRAEEQAQASQQMAAAAHRLNILAAIFFPIITLTAIFGVDLATMAAVFGFDIHAVRTPERMGFLLPGLILLSLIAGGILTRIIRRPMPSLSNEHNAKKTTRQT